MRVRGFQVVKGLKGLNGAEGFKGLGVKGWVLRVGC